MKLCKLLLAAILAVLCSAKPGLTQVYGVEVAADCTAQVLGGKSPAVQITDATGKIVASIPVEQAPVRCVYSKPSNTIYVVHNEKKSDHFISAVNLTTQRVDKQIKVGAGVTAGLRLSNDGRLLFYYTASSRPGGYEGYYYGGALKPPYEPVITVIDTASNEVIMTHEWFTSFAAAVPKSRFYSSQLLAASDEGHLVVACNAAGNHTNAVGKPRGQRLEVFSAQSPHPTFEFDPGGQVVGAMFSKDEKFVFVAIEEGKRSAGTLVVADLQKGTTVNHALTDQPMRLLRLGSKQESWVLGRQEMRSISETGELGDRLIPLNKVRKSDEGDRSSASAFLGGFPAETITVGTDHAAMLICDKSGESLHRVALLDLQQLQVDSILPTLSPGEASGIKAGRFVTALLMPGVMAASLLSPLSNEALAARPDGKFLYALDVDAHEVTVIDVQSATVAGRIRVNDSITRFRVSSDGKRLFCIGKKNQQINLESNNLE
jgi:DNA-binding beta-propeller fold protein YncE